MGKTNCENCLSPGCECFGCILRPVMEPQKPGRIASLTKQLAASRAIVKADDAYIEQLRGWISSGLSRSKPRVAGVDSAYRRRIQAREAAAQIDKETE